MPPPSIEIPEGSGGQGPWESKKKDICFQQMSFFLDETVKIDILSIVENTARRAVCQTAAQRSGCGLERSRDKMNERWLL